MSEREPKPCGSRTPHVPHPWDGRRRWCRGLGRYAEDQQPAPVDTSEPCETRYVGPTGVVWVCVRGRHHDPDPSAGYAGTGHTMSAVHPVVESS